jgi:hypothetical protein
MLDKNKKKQINISSQDFSESKKNSGRYLKRRKEHVLFVSYDGLLDPLGKSQILPYIFGLRDRGFRFSIISFEKNYRDPAEIEKLRKKLSSLGINWYFLKFLSGGGKKILSRVIMGAMAVRRACQSKEIDFIHLRGFQSALILKFAFVGKPYIYDFRGFVVDEYAEMGVIRRGSIGNRLLKRIDRLMIKDMSALVTLEKSAEERLRKNYCLPNVPTCVVRTSTNCKKYFPKSINSKGNPVRFVHLGGALFPPYQVDTVLEFVSRFSEVFGGASVSFFNEGQHSQIARAVEKSSIEKSLVSVEKVGHENVPGRLTEFDAGLIFIESSPSRRVCSPTRLGEYLAAGLPVVAGKGIEVFNDIDREFDCIKLVDVEDGKLNISLETIREIHEFIKSENRPNLCKQAAHAAFDVDTAIDKYFQLYSDLVSNLNT